MHLFRRFFSLLLGAGCLVSVQPALAKTTSIRIGKQLGLSYLPLIIAEHDHLIEKHARHQELQDKRVHRVFAAGDVLGGGGATILLFAANRVRVDHPGLNQALIGAVAEADRISETDRHRAAGIYLAAEKPSLSLEQVEALIGDPGTRYTTATRNVVQFAQFMARTGSIKNRPESWRDLFFPELLAAEGS
ncbi:hypothetical protein [Telmatospirillum siberiense]|uniref:Uncharacterized protein n=1 Tax=Telmatospirillum siberiense TaxID=382514 RepID=A0A2N3PMP8_9PROT|nr:hypothetical protein [Telmatospirillum siberiense]PKU21679.1 hypothetical protein CWS72_25485 [Telmatospirillum siberiense]